jgi:hypothetical protein
MIEKFASRSGLPTASVNGILLHSRFDPVKEAEKFILSSLDTTRASRTIVLLGESFGYLSQAATACFPGSKIIAVCYSSAILPDSDTLLVWHPDKNIRIEDFFDSALDESDSTGISVAEWPASGTLYPDISKLARKTLAFTLRKLQGNILTTTAMGRLWIRNTFSNFINISTVTPTLDLRGNKIPVIAGSGPSLERSVNILRNLRKKIRILALPSSLEHLLSHDIVPDIVVMTDPGFYSRLHLAALEDAEVTIAMPLSASRGLWGLENAKAFFIAQPFYFEKEILDSIRYDTICLPPQGTVAATALMLALRLSKSEIVCTGLDFATDDIITHARPNTFERVLEPLSNRLSPFYNIAYSRVSGPAGIRIGKNGFRTSNPLLAYAGWFTTLPRAQSERVLQLLPSKAGINTLRGIDESEMNGLIGLIDSGHDVDRSENTPAFTDYPDRRQRACVATSILDSWSDELSQTIASMHASTMGEIRISARIRDLLYFTDTRKYLDLIRESGHGKANGHIGSILSLAEEAMQFVSRIRSVCSGQRIEEYAVCP